MNDEIISFQKAVVTFLVVVVKLKCLKFFSIFGFFYLHYIHYRKKEEFIFD